MTMNPRQARFVEEFLIDVNAKEAAIRAGYSPKTAKQKGHALRQLPKIQEAIIAAIQARSKRTEAEQDWIIERLIENVNRAMTVEPVMVGGVKTGEYVYQGSVANKALELLGRHEGMFTDNFNVKGAGPVTFIMKLHDEE